ncbi:triple tyrosine motif-containing protein [Winogradskyella sp.]|uniref:triple tyrosine motif-containing protein n=1 Tax=Winogradskyella sp. TaxID=1883156 RepID=UPI0026158696|nr:triple tyrosine motif-containing protein [Winogradskyella sp.]
MVRLNKALIFIEFLIGISLFAQEIPPIQIFTQQDYQAEDQNWDISQDNEGIVYFANNKGLLRYNSARWELFPSPNQSILRSVNVIGDKIYTGCYMDFGYWEKDNYGGLAYTSLITGRDIEVKEDEQFWDIIEIEDYILFQSLDRIYIYSIENDSFKIIDSKSRINKIFKVDENIFFQKNGIGICEIKNGVEQLVIPSDKFNDNEIVNIYKDDTGLLLLTKENGMYSYSNGDLFSSNIEVDNVLNGLSIYSSIKLKDGSFLLGTVSEGVLQMSSDGKKILKIDQSGGLSNNTILSLLEGNRGNIWLGLDNGINCINLESPYIVYKDKQGVLGTIYTSIKVGDYLYLGSNQGLFYKNEKENHNFRLVKGTKGQVWYLNNLRGDLFCGHDKGTFVVKNGNATYIKGEIGTWLIKETENPNLLIQGNYEGLSVLELKNGIWSHRNKIRGFDISSRYFDFVNATELLISHEYKGVYKVAVDSDYFQVLESNKLDIKEGPKSSIAKYKDRILYSNKEGVYAYNEKQSNFVKDSTLSELIKGYNYLSGKLVVDNSSNRLWLFSKNDIAYVEPGTLSYEPKTSKISIPHELRNSKVGYENILGLNDNKYLIGTTEGYLIVDLNKLKQNSKEIKIDYISHNSLHDESIPIQLDLNQSVTLGNKNNSILFKYSITDYNKFSSKKYRYRLVGLYDNWSDWTSTPEVYFENLPHGDYAFEVMAQSSGVESNSLASYTFSIEKPWLLKPLAIVTYVLMGLALIFLIQYFNNRYYKKQKEKLIEKKQRELELEQLENQQQLIQFKNKNLQLDIENKNRELGTATMNLVKRNELLNKIKEELSRSKSLDDVKGVIRLINTNLNNTSDWKLFEEAFNNVDKDFMKRIKTIHPSITPNDLRLCAYLRLNLSSKEIAPLLNISHKSVEVKRYRLRKKMGLGHEQSLTDYILEL